MGTDIGSYLLYGVDGEGGDFATEEYDITEALHKISNDDMVKYNLKYIRDGFDGAWTVLGIQLLDQDPEVFAQNILDAPAKFKELAEKYNIDLTEFVPYYMEDAYYW